MRHHSPGSSLYVVALVVSLGCGLVACTPPPPDDLARRETVVDVLHGVEVPDPYRWLEDGTSEEVIAWTEARNADFTAATDPLPQRQWLSERLQQLLRYDDRSTPQPCLLSDRIIFSTKKAEDEKWVVHLQEGPDGEERVILDPNTWAETEQMSELMPSPDCRLAAFGKQNAGDENAVIHIMNLDTLEILPDTLRGWRQGNVSWLHDSSGFFYSSQPLEGEVPEGEQHYWFRVWFHTLGTTAEADQLVLYDPKVKERFHGVFVSEDGHWAVMGRFQFGPKTELYLKNLDSDGEPVPMVTSMDWMYSPAGIYDGKALIVTDWQAPKQRVMVADVGNPGRDHWQELIPETEDRLSEVKAVAGKLYAIYQHNAATRIAVHELDGTYLHDVQLPTVGTAFVWGHWSRPEVWLGFTSFSHPFTVYRYDPGGDQLSLYREPPIPFDPEGLQVEQVRYPSKDGTEISMFLVHREGAPRDGSVPYLLHGYGCVDVSMTPEFRTSFATWLEAGGGLAVPNIRGGGEYGREWHEAGMLDRKQNTFDDFIAAGDWLVAEGYTSRDRLAIHGGSGGGLLVSAVITQRPDLCAAVLCLVPLTDMVRYHTMGLANIWANEFGNSDDQEMFKYLLAYSPYHRITAGADYPAMLIVGSANDARTDPAHARKLVAAARWADADHGQQQPIMLQMQAETGHGYQGATIDRMVDQLSRQLSFVMDQVGLQAPKS